MTVCRLACSATAEKPAMPTFCRTVTPVGTRRDLLRASANGFGLLALGGLLSEKTRGGERLGASSGTENPLAPRLPHFAAKAKRIIFLFMHGGPSQVDTFDPKPMLARHDGKPFPGQKPRVQFSGTGNLLKSPWEFRPWRQERHSGQRPVPERPGPGRRPVRHPVGSRGQLGPRRGAVATAHWVGHVRPAFGRFVDDLWTRH